MVLWFLVAVLSQPSVSVSARPVQCFSPCDVTLEMRYQRDEDNDHLRVLIEGPNYSSYSEVALEDSSPAVLRRQFRALPAGEYEAVVSLIRRVGGGWEAGRAATRITVTSTN